MTPVSGSLVWEALLHVWIEMKDATELAVAPKIDSLQNILTNEETRLLNDCMQTNIAASNILARLLELTRGRSKCH